MNARPWGFQLEEIAMEVHLWHGLEDRNSSEAMGRYLAETLPDCRATFLPDEGHLLIYEHMEEILGSLVS